MNLIADILLASGALAAAFYCFTLGRRLRKFNDLENGMGGAVAVLSAQVDDLQQSIELAQKTTASSRRDIEEIAERANEVKRQLQLQMASLHDVVPPARPPIEPTHDTADSGPMFIRGRG